MNILWTLHYADGTKFSNLNGPPKNSPGFKVIFVTQPGINGADLIGEGAYAFLYRVDKKGWMPVYDIFGLGDQLTHYAHLISCVRFGHQMWTPDFKELATKAGREMRGR